MGERAITTLRSNALYATLILVKVNVADHVVKLDTTSDIVHTVVSIFVVIERLCVQNDWGLLLIKLSSKEGALNIVANNFDSCNDAQSILLVTDLFKAHLFDLRDLLELALGRPLKVITTDGLVVSLKHRQLSYGIFGSLNLSWLDVLTFAITDHFEFLIKH